MRIAYCTNVRLPSERAHGHQIAQVCDALVRLGHAVEVFCPYRRNVVREDFHSYYGVSPKIIVAQIGGFDPVASPFLPGVLGLWTMNMMLRSALAPVLRAGGFDLVYTRTPALLPTLLASGAPVVLELHQLPRRSRRAFVAQCNRCALVACLTSAMRDALFGWGVEKKRLAVAGDGVDLLRFAKPVPRDEARRHFGLYTSRTVVGYVGRLKTLGMDKGVAVMLRALAGDPGRRFFLFIVGGPGAEQRAYEALAAELRLERSDVLFTGEVPAASVPSALWACDVLAMPFPDFPHFRNHMSPLKMFEYMAAERPLIASDLPTVRDVLSEKTAVFCTPGSPESFRDAVHWTLDHPKEAAARASAARSLVAAHSWETRMQRILDAARA